MTRQLRIDALARDLGRPPDEVLRLLERLGHHNFHSIHQLVSETIARKVANFVVSPAAARNGGAPPSPVDVVPPVLEVADLHLFEEAMSSSGVTRMGKATPPKIKAEAGKKSPTRVVPPAAAAPPPVTAAPAAVPDVPVVAEEPPVPEGPPEPNVQDLHRELEYERSARIAAEEELRAASHENVPSHEPASITALAAARGLQSLEDVRRLVGSLAEGRHLDSFLSDLLVREPDRFVHLLETRVVRACPACKGPEGLVSLPTTPERCELCHEVPLETLVRRFSDSALLLGVTNALVAGGPAWAHRRLLRDLDRRLMVRSLPVFQPTPEMWLADLPRVQIAFFWARHAQGANPALPPETSGPSTPVLSISAVGLGEFLAEAIRRLETFDPSLLRTLPRGTP